MMYTAMYRLTAGFALVSTALLAQGNSDNVRALNGKVLNLHAQARSGNAQAKGQGRQAIEARSAALKALMKADPQAALGLAFSKDLLDDLADTFPEAASRLEQQGSWSGTSDHVIFDDVERKVRKFEVRINSAGGQAEVYSAKGEPGCVSGNTLTVEGVRLDNVIAAGNTRVQASGEQVAAATCSTLGVQNSVVILAQFPGINLPASVNPTSMYDAFFAPTGRSVDTYWREASYNQASAAGVIVGPVTLDRVYACTEYNLMRSAAIAAADSAVNFQNYTRVFIVFPDPGGCGWAGLGTLGCGTLTSADGNFQASTSWLLASQMTNRDTAVKLSTHEGGHNLSLHHASTRDFGADVLGAVGAAGTLNEYGDMYSTMGSWNLGHYGAPHKQRIGWLNASNVLTTESNGSHSVLPFETPAAGVQALKVRRGTGNDAWLWVEYRQPIGQFDSTLASGAFNGGLVHYEDQTTGTFTHLLDFTPATSGFDDGTLTGAWSDPYTNVSLAVTGASASALSINVSYGPVPCTRVTPTVSISPANPSVNSGSNVSQTVSVAKNASTRFTASTFTFASTLPGWSTSFGSPTLSVNPGQTVSTTMTKSVPAGQTPGTYSVNATAANPDHSTATGTANCTVTAPPPPLFIPSLTVSPTSVKVRSSVTVTATVTNGSTPVSGAKVTISITRPNGAVSSSKVLTTGSNGTASWSYRTQSTGSHTARATATFSGATANGGPTPFTVTN